MNSNETWTVSPVEFKSEDDFVPLEPERIIYNGRTTIVIWSDGTKTKSTAGYDDVFDFETGFAMCLLKKLYGHKVYGRKLYRRMIFGADVQGEYTREDFENYKDTIKAREAMAKMKPNKEDDLSF